MLRELLGRHRASTPVCHIVRGKAGSAGVPRVHVGEHARTIGEVFAARHGIIRKFYNCQPLLLGRLHFPLPSIELLRVFSVEHVSEAAVVLVIPRVRILRRRVRPSFAKPAPRVPRLVRLPCLEPDPVRKRHGGKQTAPS
jgi:hypothetical protein